MRVRTCLRISDAATSCLRGPHCAYLPAWLIFVFACRSVEEGISKPLQTLTRVLPTQALQDIMEARAATLLAARASLTCRTRVQDPDTKLLQQVAGSVRDSTEKNLRERCAQRSLALCSLVTHACARRLRKWVGSLEVMRSRLQPAVPPLPPPSARLRTTDGGPEQAAVDAWVDAASAVAAAETAAAKLESAIDSCQTAGLCEDMNVLAAAAEDAAEQGASQEQQPFNPS